MSAVFSAILKYAMAVLPALPQIIAGIESLFRGTKKSGSAKWIAVEQALSQSIVLVAQEVAALSPDTPEAKASTAIAVFTKTVNDAFVKLCNDLGIFQTST